MKRLLFVLFIASSMFQIAWGQASSSNGSLSPFIGEWKGSFGHYVYWNDVPKSTNLILRIESFGDHLGVRVKEISTDGQDVSYNTWDVVNASSNTLELIHTGEEHFDDDSDCWFWFVYRYTLVYDHGRLQLIGKGADECNRYRGNRVTKKYNPNIMGGFYDMYLFKNDDNW